MTDLKNTNLLLGKLKALGDKIETVATNVVSGVQTGVSTVGTGVINVAKDLKDNILDGDLDRIRSVHAFQKNQASLAQSGKRKQFSEQELDAADARAAQVLNKLPPGYFEKNYDPVRHELSQLLDSSGQDDVDAIVERLGTCMEAVSGTLTRHVMKKRDQLIVGIDLVASVEDDLKAALATARSSRSTVRNAEEEVKRHLRVAGQTRRKQTYMQLMEVVEKVHAARTLQKQLRRAQENGEYHQAILLCVQCFQGVESLRNLSVSTELLATVQRLYVDTLQKLDGALTAVCGQFDPARYTRILDAYLLQSISGASLAERVLQCFRDSINDSTSRVAKSLLLTQPQLVSRLAGGSASLEGSFVALISALPADLLPTCLVQVLEVCLTGLGSFHHMAQWHVECVAVQRQIVAEKPPDEASLATLDFLASVSDMLVASRKEVFNCAFQRMLTIIKLPAATCTGPALMQVADHCHKFLTIGESFTCCELPHLRDSVGSVLGAAFEAQHHANMQTLSALMQREDAWNNIGGPKLAHELPDGSVLGLSELMMPSRSMDGRQQDPKDFPSWLQGGSPFAPAAKQAPTPIPPGPEAEQPMLTHAGRHILKCLRAYVQMFSPLGRQRAGTVWQGITQLFDRFLTATFMLVSGIGVEALVMQEDIMTLRLQRVLLRILTAEGSRYKPQIEELQRLKAGQKPIYATQSGGSWLDRLGDRVESLANDLDRHVSKLSTAMADKYPPGLLGETGAGFQERLVAGETIALVGRELRAAKGPLLSYIQAASATATQNHLAAKLSVLRPLSQGVSPATSTSGSTTSSTGASHGASRPRLQYQGMEQVMAAQQQQGSDGGGAPTSLGPPPMAQTTPTLAKEAESYFARSVEASDDLRECLLQGSTRVLLGILLDREQGVAVAISNVKAYSGKAPHNEASMWAKGTGNCLMNFAHHLGQRTELQQSVKDRMWVAAMNLVADALTSGFARCKDCTLEGRAFMGIDLAHVETVARAVLPPGASVAGVAALERTKQYVTAYYMPWNDFCGWCQSHLAEYRSYRLMPLVDLVYHIHKKQVKEQAKNAWLQDLDAMAKEI